MTPDRSQVVGTDLRIPVFKAITTTLHKVSEIYIYICVIILWLYLTWLNSFSFHEKNIIVGNGGLERLISSHVEVSKIGRQIAEEVLDLQRRGEDSSSGSSPGPESALLNTEVVITMEIPVKILHFLWDVKQFIRYYIFNFNDLYRV